MRESSDPRATAESQAPASSIRPRFTPGPWFNGSDPHIVFADAGNPMQRIAKVTEFMPEFHDESVANARLIAAAPELLEALERIVAVLDRQLSSPLAAERSSPVGEARAAIAKATGSVLEARK